MNQPITAPKGPELVIGLVGPVGTDLRVVAKAVKNVLESFQYPVHLIRLSELIHQFDSFSYLADKHFETEFDRIKTYMDAGTKLRELARRGDLLALLSISQLRTIRERLNESTSGLSPSIRADTPISRNAYLLHSLKHPHEIETLRAVYGKGCVVISAYSTREDRVEALAGRIAKSAHEFSDERNRAKAEELISIDESEAGRSLGQNVSDTFPLGDLFLDVREEHAVEKQISRFMELFFGNTFHTPTRDEFGMFHAKSAALRSADLARQVGAVITDDDGAIIAVGCNDVPKAGGGLYWADDLDDHRDYKLGYDSSAFYKRQVLGEVLSRLGKSGWLSDDKSQQEAGELVEELLDGKSKEIMRDAQIMNLLEYGRSVHAEMAALMDAARRGVGVKKGTLFSTTFPCHLCARHIVAAGITRVVYIEPYPKSMAKKLYRDSIIVDSRSNDEAYVSFEPFVGVAPRRYLDLFEMTKRKESNGEKKAWDKPEAEPRIYRYVASYLQIEQQIVGETLPTLIDNSGLKLLSGV